MFNIQRLEFAMQRRGLSKSMLAKQLSVDSRTITNYFTGKTEPNEEKLRKIAEVLDFSLDFFYGDDLPKIQEDTASFRSLSRMTAKLRDKALTYGVTGFLFSDWLENEFEGLPSADLPNLSEQSPEGAAKSLRALWGLGDLPISNMVALLESKGVKVFSLTLEAKEVDAFSVWHQNKPFVYLNTMKTAERSRFDAAHELGHLIRDVDSMKHGEVNSKNHKEIEKEANEFASAFLIPETRLLLYKNVKPTIENLIKIKAEFGVSVAALAYRMYKLNFISEWVYTREICPKLAKYGYRTQEPNEMDREKSLLLKTMLEFLKAEKISIKNIADSLNVSVSDIDSLTFGLATHLRLIK